MLFGAGMLHLRERAIDSSCQFHVLCVWRLPPQICCAGRVGDNRAGIRRPLGPERWNNSVEAAVECRGFRDTASTAINRSAIETGG
jgi:hypothetical protein